MLMPKSPPLLTCFYNTPLFISLHVCLQHTSQAAETITGVLLTVRSGGGVFLALGQIPLRLQSPYAMSLSVSKWLDKNIIMPHSDAFNLNAEPRTNIYMYSTLFEDVLDIIRVVFCDLKCTISEMIN